MKVQYLSTCTELLSSAARGLFILYSRVKHDIRHGIDIAVIDADTDVKMA